MAIFFNIWFWRVQLFWWMILVLLDAQFAGDSQFRNFMKLPVWDIWVFIFIVYWPLTRNTNMWNISHAKSVSVVFVISSSYNTVLKHWTMVEHWAPFTRTEEEVSCCYQSFLLPELDKWATVPLPLPYLANSLRCLKWWRPSPKLKAVPS